MGKCIEEDGATLCLRHSLRALLEVTIEAGDSHFGLYAWTTFASCIFPSCPALQSTGAQSKRRSRDSSATEPTRDQKLEQETTMTEHWNTATNF